MNTGATDIKHLTFYWIGVNLYPWGMLPAPSYPASFSGLAFADPFVVPAVSPLAPPRLNQPFSVKPDGDFAIRGGQAADILEAGNIGSLNVATPSFMSIVLRDYNGMPYSNDWVDINIMFGRNGLVPDQVPVGASSVGPFGSKAGLIYPEIYLPLNRQLLMDVNHPFGVLADLVVSFFGAKVGLPA
jgi:hypothetical protein